MSMKLNHDIYKEAMDSIRLSDKTGLALIDEAIHRKEQRKQKQKLQAAAAIAAILITGLGINGICYAQTGMNVLEMFTFAFNNESSGGMESLAEGVTVSGESITDGNLQFTLEHYFYDKENSELFFAFRTTSLDGTPLDWEQVDYDYNIDPTMGSGEWRTSDPIMNEDNTSCLQYYYILEAIDDFGNPMEQMDINLKYYTDEDVTLLHTFKLEPSAKMKVRYADCSILDNCSQKAKMTGLGIRLKFDEEWKEIKDPTNPFITMEYEPFYLLDIVMKDGTIYRSEADTPDKVIPIYNNSGEITNQAEIDAASPVPEYVSDSEKIKKCPARATTRSLDTDAEKWSSYTIPYGEFINVDDIAAVYIDGVEIPLE